MVEASRVLTKVLSRSYLSVVVTRRSSYGWQARMLWRDSLSSSKLLCIVGIIIVTSLDVYDGLDGISYDL